VLYLRVDSMEERVRYLASIGVGALQMGKVISRLPQLLSLDVANNMAPKFEYLRSELGGTVDTIAGFPAYFSLSMPQRCAPLLLPARRACRGTGAGGLGRRGREAAVHGAGDDLPTHHNPSLQDCAAAPLPAKGAHPAALAVPDDVPQAHGRDVCEGRRTPPAGRVHGIQAASDRRHDSKQRTSSRTQGVMAIGCCPLGLCRVREPCGLLCAALGTDFSFDWYGGFVASWQADPAYSGLASDEEELPC
jgi:mTERF